MSEHRLRIVDWGNVGEPTGVFGEYERWITIEVSSSTSLENYPYKEPFITWVAWFMLFERLFGLSIVF